MLAGQAGSREAATRLGPLAVRGAASCEPPVAADGDRPASVGVVDLDLGIDRFHVNQREAERIDKLLASRRAGEQSPVAAIVSIGGDGRARLKGLMVEGRRLELSWD